MGEQIWPRVVATASKPALTNYVDDLLFAKVWEQTGLSNRYRNEYWNSFPTQKPNTRRQPSISTRVFATACRS